MYRFNLIKRKCILQKKNILNFDTRIHTSTHLHKIYARKKMHRNVYYKKIIPIYIDFYILYMRGFWGVSIENDVVPPFWLLCLCEYLHHILTQLYTLLTQITFYYIPILCICICMTYACANLYKYATFANNVVGKEL